jgi:hypothetical protein
LLNNPALSYLTAKATTEAGRPRQSFFVAVFCKRNYNNVKFCENFLLKKFKNQDGTEKCTLTVLKQYRQGNYFLLLARV